MFSLKYYNQYCSFATTGEEITKRGHDAAHHLRAMTKTNNRKVHPRTNRKSAAYPLENAEVRSARTLKSKAISNRQETVNWSCGRKDAVGAAGRPTDPEGQQIQDEIAKQALDRWDTRTHRQRLVLSLMVESTADLQTSKCSVEEVNNLLFHYELQAKGEAQLFLWQQYIKYLNLYFVSFINYTVG